MSYAVTRPGGDAPTTAAVLDFACLFTHDLRRKQKRWQDGRLKYHTFNRRVMVYDERGNLVGDGHWAGGELGEGEELELDRGGAIVQVAQCTGAREQDLSEVVDRRAREVARRRVWARERAVVPSGGVGGGGVPSPVPLGRAVVPERSPYEARRERPGYAQSLFGARLTLSSGPGAAPRAVSGTRDERRLSCPSAPKERRDERARPTAKERRAAPAAETSHEAAEETTSCAPEHVEDTPPGQPAEPDEDTPPRAPAEEPPPPPPRRAGPRAELRIRPRHRRGLLMVLEQRQRQAARELDACPKPRADRLPEPDHSGAAPVAESSDGVLPVDRRPPAESSSESDGDGDGDGSDSPASCAASERSPDESDSSAPSPPRKRRAERNPKAPAPTGPRITRMARKSVKSKEIVGFVLPPADVVPAFAATGPIAFPARIANPATRGRKAARREDAAGPVPQSLVPLEPVAAPEPRQPCLPGFSRADGGAWSKHAEDLLGMARPTRALRCYVEGCLPSG